MAPPPGEKQPLDLLNNGVGVGRKNTKGDPAKEIESHRRRLLNLLTLVADARKDPRVLNGPPGYAKFEAVLGDIADLELLLLKGHLLIEEALFGLLAEFCERPDLLEKMQLSFAQKFSLARAFGFISSDVLVSATTHLNTTRNKMAHHAVVHNLHVLVDEYIHIFRRGSITSDAERVSLTQRALACHLGLFQGLVEGIQSLHGDEVGTG